MTTPPSLPSLPPQDSDHHRSAATSPTPSSTPSSPKPIPPQQSTTSPPKKIPPLPWTHLETINLIQAYQEKWYSLKKGQLKAGQWEEVAVTVAARCGYDEPSKSATQCRHKIEKLRKRYRAEKLKPYPNSWQYFDPMNRMEKGPLPISAHPMSMFKYPQTEFDDDNEGSDSDMLDNLNYNDHTKKNKSKSISHILRGDPSMNRHFNNALVDQRPIGGNERILRSTMVGKRKYYESDEEEEAEENEEEEGEGGGREMLVELATEIRAFAERFVKMESKKIEMMRETERYLMEMENKRMEMILESQRKIVDSISRAFGR